MARTGEAFPYDSVADEINNFLYPPLGEERVDGVCVREQLGLDEPMPGRRPFVLYVSVPYCRVRCHSCHCFRGFLPHGDSRDGTVDAYVTAVARQIRAFAGTRRFSSVQCEAIYIGGGTGSLLNAEQVRRLLDVCRDTMDLAADVEINLEGNPEDFLPDYLEQVRAAGVTRLSIGFQSRRDDTLRILNSPHDARQGIASITNALRAGFRTVNVDLLYNVSGQTEDMWVDELESLMALGPQGISTGDYVVFPGTAAEKLIAGGRFAPQHALDTVDEWYRLASDLLEKRGYHEQVRGIHAKEGHEQKYVHLCCPGGCEIMGVGAGSYAFVNRYQFRNVLNTDLYMRHAGEGRCFEADHVSREASDLDLQQRYVMHNFFASRIDRRQFSERFGRDLLEVFPEIFGKLTRHDLVRLDEDSVWLTDLGKKWRRNIYHEFRTSKGEPPLGVVGAQRPATPAAVWPPSAR